MFSYLDGMANLRVLRLGRNIGQARRRVTGGCNDAVTDLLASCQTPSELADMALRFGVPAEEISRRAGRAATFGQFRMAIGNRIRGVVRRLQRAGRQGEVQ